MLAALKNRRRNWKISRQSKDFVVGLALGLSLRPSTEIDISHNGAEWPASISSDNEAGVGRDASTVVASHTLKYKHLKRIHGFFQRRF